jgi:hypothetical protein
MNSSPRTLIVFSLLLAGCGQSSSSPETQEVPMLVPSSGAAGASSSTPTSAAGTSAPTAAGSGTVAAAGQASPAPVAGTVAALGGSGGATMTIIPVTAGAGGATTAAAGAGGSGAIAELPGTVTLTTDSFVLKAGQEVYKCQNFDNPFGSKDTAIKFVSTDMSPGSHHLHVYHMTTDSSRTLQDCTIQDFHPLLFTAGAPHVEITYPQGMAAKLLGTAGIRIQVHYLNTTDNDINVKAVLKMAPADSTITKWVSELYFNQLSVRVPPGDGTMISTSCAIPDTFGPIGLVAGGTHMHARGVHFTAQTSTGIMLADVNTWDEPPPITYDPPIMLNPGDKITWTCTYNNTTDKTLTFGESAEDNEMCIYLGRFFSDPDGSQLECQANGPTGTTTTRTY